MVAKEYSRRTGLKIARVNQTRKHAAHGWMRANLDRRVIGKPEIVEIKTVRGLGDEPRPDHLLQVRHYMAVTGTERAHLVYLIAGQRLQSFVIERDQAAETALMAAEAAFWECVQTHTPPAVQRITDLRLLHPQDNGQAIAVDCDTAYALKQLTNYRARKQEAEEEISRYEAVIQAAMGDAAALLSETGQTLATWKTSKPSEMIDTKRLREEQPELAARYLTTRQGSRRFIVKEATA